MFSVHDTNHLIVSHFPLLGEGAELWQSSCQQWIEELKVFA